MRIFTNIITDIVLNSVVLNIEKVNHNADKVYENEFTWYYSDIIRFFNNLSSFRLEQCTETFEKEIIKDAFICIERTDVYVVFYVYRKCYKHSNWDGMRCCRDSKVSDAGTLTLVAAGLTQSLTNQ